MADRDNVLIGAGELTVDGVNVGYTRDGLTFAFERETYEVEADQALSPLKTVKLRERMTIATSLLEATLENLYTVWDLDYVVQTNASDKTLYFGGGSQTPSEHELIFTGVAPGGFVRTITIYKAISMDSGEHSYIKSEEVRIPVTFLALEDDTKSEGQKLGKIVDTTS